jgi:hypothetical protein
LIFVESTAGWVDGRATLVNRPMSLPPLTAVRTFEVAGRLLSFTRAAAELCVTPSAVSRQIRTLEEHPGHRELGTKQDVVDAIGFYDELAGYVRESAKEHSLFPMQGSEATHAHLDQIGDLLYDVTDKLRPKYGSWTLFEEASLQIVMWEFVNGLVLAD